MKFVRFVMPAVLLLASFGSDAKATEFSLVNVPSNGYVTEIPSGDGFAYYGQGGADSFEIMSIDDNGMSITNVELDPSVGHFLTTVNFNGPIPSRVQTFAIQQEGKAEKDEGYVVIIYVDQPGAGGDRDPYEGNGITSDIVVGHTFVEVTDGNTGTTVTHGLYPTGGVKPNSPETGGMVKDDTGHDWDVKYEIPVTKAEYEKIIKKIEEDKKNPPDYNLNDNNCTDWALCLLDEINKGIDSKEGTWRGGGGHNPGDIGEDLIPLGGTRNPTPGGGGDSSGK